MSNSRENSIYEEVPYQKPALPSVKNWGDYLEEIKTYCAYFAKDEEHEKKLLKWSNTWLKFSGFKKFVEGLDTSGEGVTRFYRQTDKQELFRHSLLTISYGILFKEEGQRVSMAKRATSLVASALEFRRNFLEGKLSQDTFKGEPLEMGQYANLFGTTLLPGKKDRISKVANDRFIVVAHRGEFYRLGLPLSAEGRFNGEGFEAALVDLMRVASFGEISNSGHGLGLLALLERGQTAKVFKKLERSQLNRDSLTVLNQALFMLCLDGDGRPEDRETTARELYSRNCVNRWFPNSLQLVVFGNGRSGVVLSNRNNLDGNVGARFARDLIRGAKGFESQTQRPVSSRAIHWSRLEFQLDSEEVKRAKESVSQMLHPESSMFELKRVGGDEFQKLGINSDASFKMAIALAFRRTMKKKVKLIQILTMSKFRYHGLAHGFISTKEGEIFLDYLSENSMVDKRVAFDLYRHALRAHREAQRKTRRGFSLLHALNLFMQGAGVPQKVLTAICAIRGRLQDLMPDSASSHPTTYPEFDAFGRPGIQIPYVKYFGCHYTIHSDSMEIIYMPTKDFKIPLADFTRAIEEGLMQFLEIAQAAREKTNDHENLRDPHSTKPVATELWEQGSP